MTAATTGDDSDLVGLEAFDQVDGQFVLRVKRMDANGNPLSEMSIADDVQVEITSGDGDIERDPYTGRFLLTPRGSAPVRGRAVVESGQAEAVQTAEAGLGMRLAAIPDDEQGLSVTGGGACVAVWQVAMQSQFEVNVRASVMSNVVPLDETRREMFWRFGTYYAHDPVIGFMRLRYNPAFTSKLVLESTDGQPFFPSRVENNLYFLVDFMDLGYQGFNRVPMRQQIESVTWPPFESAVLEIEEPIEFYDVANPDRVLMTLVSQDMRLYDYSSIDVHLLDASIDAAGRLTSRWRISNQAEERARVRWFALGDVDAFDAADPLEGTRLLGAAGSGLESFDVEIQASTKRSLLRQTLAMNAVSLTDTILAGRAQLDYRTTDQEQILL